VSGIDQTSWAQLGSPAGTVALTSPLDTDPFMLVGLTWPRGAAPASLSVSVRVREAGQWSDWQELEVTEDAPDPGSGEQQRGRSGTEPMITGTLSDGVQVHVQVPTDSALLDGEQAVDGLQLELVDPGTSPADDDLGRLPAGSASAAGAARPQIITRAQWGADESARNGNPSYSSTIKVGFVHHTVTSNTYSREAAAAQVRAIYAYDTNGLGWSDIGYNFLVDRFGRIYEGRAGGVEKAVIGAHTAGFNKETFGVAALGCFDLSCSDKLGGPASPPSAMVDSIGAVIGWKLGLFGRDPKGTAVLTSSGTGGTNTKYPKGTKVTTAVVSSHRDNNATACPGSSLYPLVSGRIRDVAAQAADQAAPAPSLSSTPTIKPSAAVWGQASYTLTAQTSTPADWTLQIRAPGSTASVWTTSGTATSSINATWDGTRTDGSAAPPGPYQMRLTTSGPDGQAGQQWSNVVEILPGAGTSSQPSRRLNGSDRYGTAVAIGRDAYPSSRTVVLVNGENAHTVDGLVAAPLARAVGGPVLATKAGQLPAPTAAEITRRGVNRVFIVGGQQAVPPAIVTALRELGVSSSGIHRLDGSTRYATAAQVARQVAQARQAAGQPVESVVIASGAQAHLIDAAAAGGPAAAIGAPILLAGGNTLPAPTREMVEELSPTRAYVLGGTGVIGAGVVAGLSEAAPSVSEPRRLGGPNRYATAAQVADAFTSQVSPSTVVLASGEDANLIDSLAGGALGHLTLLTTPTPLTDVTATWLRNHSTGGVLVLGGQIAISSKTFWTAASAVAGQP
jgi:putative cell wall-binding protein